jgi:hypothetical protein
MQCDSKSGTLNKGASGTISNSLRQYLSNIVRKHDVKELQNTAMLDTAHVLWKVLMQKYFLFNVAINLYVPKIVTTELLQQYIP